MEKKVENYKKIITTFSEPKASNRKIKNISWTTIYVAIIFITLISFTYLGYFNFSQSSDAPYFLNGLETKTVFYTILAVTVCLAIFVFKPHVVNRSLYFCIPLIIIAFIGTYVSSFFRDNYLMLLIPLTMLAVGTGFIFTAAIFAFIYTLSSSERLFSTIFLIAGIVFYFYLQRLLMLLNPMVGEFILPLIALIALYISIFFVDSSDFGKIVIKNEKIPYLSVIIMVVYVYLVIMNEAVNSAIKHNLTQNYQTFSDTNFFIGSACALIIGATLFRKFRYGLISSCIIWSFLVLATHYTGTCYLIFSRNLFILEIIMGVNSGLGLMSAIMMVGKVFEDKANYQLLRIVIVFIATGLISSRFLAIGLQGLNLHIIHTTMEVFAFLVVVIIVGFTIQSFMRLLIAANNDQKSDRNNQKETYLNPQEVLTTKELLVFEQLISGATLRQIAGELKMKYDTVNFHYKNIYRKLEVNSKVELIVRYGKR